MRGGAASPYFFRNERGRHADALLAAAKMARAEKLGYLGRLPQGKAEYGPRLGHRAWLTDVRNRRSRINAVDG